LGNQKYVHNRLKKFEKRLLDNDHAKRMAKL